MFKGLWEYSKKKIKKNIKEFLAGLKEISSMGRAPILHVGG